MEGYPLLLGTGVREVVVGGVPSVFPGSAVRAASATAPWWAPRDKIAPSG